MNRRIGLLVVSCFSAGLLAMGCSANSDQPSGSDANSSSSTAKSAIKKALEPKPIMVPADTILTVILDQTIGSKTATSGDKFSATVQTPVEAGGRVAIPKDARASGIVKDAKAAGRFKGGAVLSLTLTSITVDGKDYEIQTSTPTIASKGKGKRTAAMVGGGAAGGAAIGAVAGGGKGAGIGALIGAAAGTGGAGLTGNRDITFAAETALNFKLVQAVEIKQK